MVVYLGSSYFPHDRDPYTWWSSDAAAAIGDAWVCVKCLSPHEGVALQVAPHILGWPLHYRLRFNSIYLMMSALAAYSASLILSLRFCEPFPAYRGHLGCIFISCTKLLLYKSWLLFQTQHVCGIHHSIFSSLCLCQHVLYSLVPCLLDTLFFCTLSRWA